MYSNRLFNRYPWLYIALGLYLIANNIFKFFPTSVLSGKMAFIVPAVMLGFGCFFYFQKLRNR